MDVLSGFVLGLGAAWTPILPPVLPPVPQVIRPMPKVVPAPLPKPPVRRLTFRVPDDGRVMCVSADIVC